MNKYSPFRYIRSELLKENAVKSIYKCAVNDDYIVQFSKLYFRTGLFKKIMIDHMWIRTKGREGKANISWSEKQRIKQIFFPDQFALEVFPPNEALVDNANIYHLYVFPIGYDMEFGLHRFNEIPREKSLIKE